MAFDDVPRPDGLLPLIGKNPSNNNGSGFQGAHVPNVFLSDELPAEEITGGAYAFPGIIS